MRRIQQVLPEEYSTLSQDEMERRILAVKERLGKRLVILGHHYQKDDVLKFADIRGDSLKLSQLAAMQTDAEFIVFCGVHFMAETADILSSPDQKVILPNLMAGCSMADMADLEELEVCWERLSEEFNIEDIIPITYVNSTAEVKAFCGRHNGMTCTSGNANRVLSAVLRRGKSVLFLPDEHLGRNTGLALGISRDEMMVWDPKKEDLICDHADHAHETNPRIILWKGLCCVHKGFTPEQIDKVRSDYPGIKVVVHPECDHSVVAKADDNGSTEYIIQTIAEAPSGSSWAIGTELNLVTRLAKNHPDKTIVRLNDKLSICRSMNLIFQNHLLWVLENLEQGRVVNQVIVNDDVISDAGVALERMLNI